jgi:hypothetical protein
MNGTPLSRIECLQAAKRFTALSLDHALGAVLSPSHASTIWHSKCEVASRDFYEAFRRSGLNYQEVATKVGTSYKLCSWVIRGVKSRPPLEHRIREVFTLHEIEK